MAQKNQVSVNADEAGFKQKAAALEEATPCVRFTIIEFELDNKKRALKSCRSSNRND
jgi:hypothetical protein